MVGRGIIILDIAEGKTVTTVRERKFRYIILSQGSNGSSGRDVRPTSFFSILEVIIGLQ